MIELKSPFARLIVTVNKIALVLGMLPSQIKKWVARGEN